MALGDGIDSLALPDIIAPLQLPLSIYERYVSHGTQGMQAFRIGPGGFGFQLDQRTLLELARAQGGNVINDEATPVRSRAVLRRAQQAVVQEERPSPGTYLPRFSTHRISGVSAPRPEEAISIKKIQIVCMPGVLVRQK